MELRHEVARTCDRRGATEVGASVIVLRRHFGGRVCAVLPELLDDPDELDELDGLEEPDVLDDVLDDVLGLLDRDSRGEADAVDRELSLLDEARVYPRPFTATPRSGSGPRTITIGRV